MADPSRSRFPVAHARISGGDRPQLAKGLNEPSARSLEYWAAVRGNAPALFEGTASLSYRDWNEYADMLADTFAARGLGHDDVIAVCCRNRIEWAVVALACSKLDARLLTLDTALPANLLRDRLIAGCAAALIIGDVTASSIAPELEGLPLLLRASMDDACPGFFSFWDLFPPVAPPRYGAAQPVVMAWTAQAEGRAGPVGVPRRRAAPASISRPPAPEAGATLMTLELHRVWSAMQFWQALIAGRAIVMMRSFEPRAAVETIARCGVTHWAALPETLAGLQAHGMDPAAMRSLSSLRELLMGGAPAPAHLKSWLFDTFGAIFSEAYGSPETGLIARIGPEQSAARPDSCGRPLRGVIVQVRDAKGQRLPNGVTGHLWVRTQRSITCELPAARYSSRRDADGFVATGDAGRIDDDGFIYLTGRASDLAETSLRRAG